MRPQENLVGTSPAELVCCWEWVGLLRDDQHVIAAKSSRTDRILKRESQARRVKSSRRPRACCKGQQSPRLDVKRIYLAAEAPSSFSLTRMWTHGRRCASTCTPEGMLLCCTRAAPPQIFLGPLIFFILFDLLSRSSGSRRWIISQMDTSDLLENISCHCLNKHKDELVS